MKLEHIEDLAEVLLSEKQKLWEQAEAEEKDLSICITDSSEGEIVVDESGQVLISDDICGPAINISVDADTDEEQIKALAEVIAVAVDALDIEFDEDHIAFSSDVNGDCVMEKAELVMACGFDQ